MRNGINGKVNIKDVAKRAGTSPSTVSRVLTGKGNVSKEKVRRVHEAIKELNYSPNVVAKSLKMGYSNTIALMVPSMANQIYPTIVQGVEDEARKSGYIVILCNTDEDINIEKDYIEKLKNRFVDGFIVATMLPESHHIVQLNEENFPVVLVCRSYDESINSVVIDNYKSAYDATSYLINTGHKRIAIASGDTNVSLYEQRFRGYVDALKDYGMTFDPELAIYEDTVRNTIYYRTKEIMSKENRPDAVFATSDPKAIIVMRAILDMGLKIPDDVSVLGFDNIELSSMLEPPLSTVSQPLYEIGVMAAKKLIGMIRSKNKMKPTIDYLKTDLLIRRSTKIRKT